MKVTVFGPAAGYGPHGVIESWGPNQLVEVDDSDKKAVTHWKAVVAAGRAELVEDVKTKPAEPTLEDLKARAEELGMATYGSKSQLAERIAKAEKEGK